MASESKRTKRSKDALQFMVVCACNMNRSMAAHKALAADGFAVDSSGTARQVKLPAPTGALTCPFGTPYQSILDKVHKQGTTTVQWYKTRKLLSMLERNVGIKAAPVRWQELSASELAEVDVAITFEERVFDALNEDVASRLSTSCSRPLHVVNLETRDDPSAAQVGAKYALEFARSLCKEVDESVALKGLPLSSTEAELSCDGRFEDAERVNFATVVGEVLPGVVDDLLDRVMEKGCMVPLHAHHLL